MYIRIDMIIGQIIFNWTEGGLLGVPLQYTSAVHDNASTRSDSGDSNYN